MEEKRAFFRRTHHWRTYCVSLLTLGLLLAPVGLSAPDVPLPRSEGPLFERITDKARALAAQPYRPPDTSKLPQALAALDYDQYRDIRFRKSQALWRGQALFSVEFFHRAFLYTEPVLINEVIGEGVRSVAYDAALFDPGKNTLPLDELGPHTSFAGFRVHYPINRPDYADEVVAFLGASYFRMVGRGQSYGVSARGLAIDTALASGEEFPWFSEFWLVRPAAKATTMTIYALLESKSVVGVYRFDLTPGADTVLDVEVRLFARADIQKLGVAPLTSMFLYGENRTRFFDDFRPEVHDSDGLVMETGTRERIWRPLTNDGQLRVSSLLTEKLGGFGLAQRDRDFNSYLDLEAHYEKRPSLWVRPRDGDWGKGMVQLIEIPTRQETQRQHRRHMGGGPARQGGDAADVPLSAPDVRSRHRE